MIAEIIIEKGFIESKKEILNISKKGGGIDRKKLNEMLNYAS